MKKKLSEWLNRARGLDATIGARIEGASHGLSTSPRQPLEVVHAVVDGIAAELQPAGRGQVAFPFTQVRVVLRAATPRDRAKLEVACEGPPTLEARIHERLTSSRSTTPLPAVKVTFVLAARPDWQNPDFNLELSRGVVAAPAQPAPAALPSPRPAAQLTLSVEHGTAEHATYTFSGGVIAIGRGSEVRHVDGRLLRTNQVVFVEAGGEVNGSVSRRHARIECDASDGTYRLFDDAGGERTSVVRDGKGLRVPHGRGLRLRSGDLIAIGDARLGVVLEMR